eukprot:TRINITY_DN22144_c0_g1_i1.p1 TRINITY_DN22144_c0_g1~~TRINITY_DN22144_c0_g1_i1.p1  ORF type:complete len:240 (-),score=67.11 TRINITY_DN22144_c0_g1_i1:13-732(-)
MNVRANCVRSLGSFLQSMRSPHFDLSILQDIILNAIQVVILNASSSGKMVKVRWNACYASGCILSNESLFEDPALRHKLIQSLIPIIDDCPNFKVRLAAANALCSVKKRSYFGEELYPQAISSLLTSFLTSASVLEDPEESKHKSDLSDQIVLSLCHLVTLGDATDLSRLNKASLDVLDYLSTAFSNAALRISPERFSVLLEAKRHVEEMKCGGSEELGEERAFDDILRINANLLLEFG